MRACLCHEKLKKVVENFSFLMTLKFLSIHLLINLNFGQPMGLRAFL